MAKKQEVKSTKKETIDKVIDTLNILVIPVSSVVAIWASLDVSAYVAGGVAVINSALEYWKMFLKD